MSYIVFPQLREYGIKYCRVHLLRLMRAGRFPAQRQITANRVGWLKSEIEEFLASRPPGRALTGEPPPPRMPRSDRPEAGDGE
jgi:predicted DNA-binding transcriptional regulator AlpA